MSSPSWQLFERVAGEYDQVLPFFAGYGAEIVAVLDPQPGCRFLDLGAGRGALTAAALGRGCEVTAVDAAPAMVDRLAASHPTVDARVMDAQALAFPDGTFDLVAAAFVIHVLEDPAAGVAQAYRVLTPGGRFAFTGGGAGGGGVEPTSLGSRLDALFAEFAAYLPPSGGMGRSLDPAQVLAAAGFVDIRQERVSVAVPVPDNATLWRWAMSHGYRAFIEDLPEQRRRQFQDRMLALPDGDRTLRRESGLWSGRKPAG